MAKEKNNLLSKSGLEDLENLERYIEEFSLFLPLAVFTINPTGNIVDINQAAKKLSGYDEVHVIGREVEFLFLDKKLSEFFIGETLKNGYAENQEMILITKNKDQIPVKVSSSVRKDREENIIGCFLAIFDISEIKKFQIDLEKRVKDRTEELENARKALTNMLEDAEEAGEKVKEEKEKIQTIISSFTDPIIFIDNNNELSLFNNSAEVIFNLSDKDLGKKVSDKGNYSMENFRGIIKEDYKINKISLAEDGTQNQSDVESAIFTIEELNIKYKDLEKVYRVMTSSVCNNNNLCYGYIKIFYDLTREKQIDKLKSEFISIAAHQLRTPLSAIKWIIKMVLDGDAGELTIEQEELLTKGYKSNERIIRLVNDLLNVSRIEEGRFGYNFQYNNFQDVLNIVTENAEGAVGKKHLKLTVDKPDKLPNVYMDKERIIMIIQNLLDNAINYTPENGKIEIKIKKIDKDINISIKDSGVGIPEKNKAKIFSKFFRGENVMRMQTEGTGLGLFISKNIIEKHNGKIDIKSKEGIGTEVIITLPIKKSKKISNN